MTDSTAPTALTATATLSLVVNEAPLSITTRSLPNATVGTLYGATLAGAGGTSPYSWTIASGSLPVGMSLAANGVISGTPTGQGSSTFMVQAMDATSPSPLTAIATLSIVVFPPAGTTLSAQSSNWSGYVEINGPFGGVTGTFSVPSLTAGTPSGDQMSVWAGVGGGNGGGDNSLIQAGFNESPDPGSPSGFIIQPWWEILPNAETFISSVQIQAGDHVTVSIGQISGTEWGITLTDDTNGESFTTDQMYSGLASTAEWIVEALTENQKVTTLAPYAPYVNFSDLGFLGANTNLQQVVMVQVGSQVSTPSALTPNGFNVAYGSTPPPSP